MALEPIGALFVVVGLACLLGSEAVGIFALLIATLLGASAGLFLTVAGDSNIQPAHLLLAFLTIDLAIRRPALSAALANLAYPRAGFWLLLTIVYGAIVTIVMPRLFAGSTYVFSLAQTGSDGAWISLAPLHPSSANFTQMVYLTGGLVCFLLFCAYARDAERLSTIAKAVIACALVNVVFAVLDLATFVTGTSYLLDPIRNSSYRILDGVELGGVKRVVGSFPEASAFAYATLGLFAFTFELWLRGLYRPYAGLAALLSLIALILSTSSAGYFGVACFLSLQYARCVLSTVRREATHNSVRFILLGPLVLAVVAGLSLLIPEMHRTVQRIWEITILSKLESASGIERVAWNTQALAVLRDTSWLGAGIGSVRASSWPVAVLASMGLVGAILYGMFVVRSLFVSSVRLAARESGIVSAARALCIAQLIISVVGVSFVDLGLLFFALAGVVSGATAPTYRTTPYVRPVRYRPIARHAAGMEAAYGNVKTRNVARE